MNLTSSGIGQGRSWNLLKKLGEGDAGEVFLVESLLDKKKAILKRPRKSAFPSEIIRQASQIENEGRILRALNGLRPHLKVRSDLPGLFIRTPLLLDQSQPGTEFSDRFFIVVEKAPGFDFSRFARLVHSGMVEGDELPSEEKAYLQSITDINRFPRPILLRGLAGTLRMFEAIHNLTLSSQEGEKSGIVWNDVKPEHIFWDPRASLLTIIDWGNAQFLETDGYNKDHSISRVDDFTQYVQSFRNFLSESDPQLLDELDWPSVSTPLLSYSDRVRILSEKINEHLQVQNKDIHSIRELEFQLITTDSPTPTQLKELLSIQQMIFSQGEMPDFPGAERFCTQLAYHLLHEEKLNDFAELSTMTCHIHADNPLKWQVLHEIAKIATDGQIIHPAFLQAISAGLIDDWPSALWNLLIATANLQEPPWWDDVAQRIRQMGLGVNPDLHPPLVVLRRNLLLLQSTLQKQDDRLVKDKDVSTSQQNGGKNLQKLIERLKLEIVDKWEQTEPDPPNSNITYNDIQQALDEIGEYQSEAQRAIHEALEQPLVQVKFILDAWEAQDYAAARRGLRRLFLWDPDRRRVILADRTISNTTHWLEKIRQGPQNGQPLIDFVTEVEFTGREIRNHVSPAEWLDIILEALSQLRKGRKPGELLVERPELNRIFPWLNALNPRRYIPAQPAEAIKIERILASQAVETTVQNFVEQPFGSGENFFLAEPLDTWAPEARGSSARTFVGFLRNPAGQLKQAAIKVMRPNRIEYALPLFREEVQVLHLMRDVPGIIPMLEFGFLQLNDASQFPSDTRNQGARNINGTVQRFCIDQIPAFLSILDGKAHQGWLPYLAIPKLDNQENLMWICDTGYTHGRFLPVEQSLRLAIQICDLIEIAHQRNIVYRDHKLLHYYWLEIFNGVFMIDWNVARYHPDGLSQAELQFDLVQLGARALHHIFTGRVAPGALADGPNLVEEIEASESSYRVQWTYDDTRLPPALKEILEKLLAGEYPRAMNIRQELFRVYQDMISDSTGIQDEKS
jgi:serine/threonine protein kinase